MTVETGKVLQVTPGWKNAENQDVQNVFHFLTDFIAPQSDAVVFNAMQTLMDDLFGAFEAYIDNSAEPDVMKIDVVEFGEGGKWNVVQNVAFEPWGGGITPAATGDALPGGVSLLGTLYTAIGKHAGRKFFGMFTEDSVQAQGLFNATTVAAVATGLAELVTPYIITAQNSLAGVIIDRSTGLVRDILEVAATTIPAYQRRRRAGTGS